ncbi:unnamed protein product [marine sediment metagenome]|uniref:Uncharacterized protein n=1 Tax=marine sediment metagenome TaxID=412755 RepID=X1HB17_9ZZZZ
MAGNTRGKLKEQFEGIHNNFTWCLTHMERALVLIKEHKPELTDGIVAMAEETQTLDKLAQGIYSKL